MGYLHLFQLRKQVAFLVRGAAAYVMLVTVVV